MFDVQIMMTSNRGETFLLEQARDNLMSALDAHRLLADLTDNLSNIKQSKAIQPVCEIGPLRRISNYVKIV